MTATENLYILITFIIFLLSGTIQLFYYLYFYTAIHFYESSGEEAPPQPVSVIICARNEAENLKKFLPAILEQDYPDYEVIVVNDCSEEIGRAHV